jgi:hypothetical protein
MLSTNLPPSKAVLSMRVLLQSAIITKNNDQEHKGLLFNKLV